MAQQQQQERHRSLSDISHLFLSSVRERATGSAALPRRKPPARQPSVDLTPEEFRHVLGMEEEPTAVQPLETAEAEADQSRVPPVKAIIASHLGAGQVEAARRYGRNLAAAGKRIGLIIVDASEFSLFTFDASSGSHPRASIDQSSTFDTRAMKDAVNELSCDIDQWLLLAMNPRLVEARALLRDAASWVVLSTCDDEGIVACYRAIKGLAELSRNRVSLAALDAQEPGEADALFQKLSGVCGQFLRCAVEPEPSVGEAHQVMEVPLMICRASHDKAQLATANHWQVVADLLAQAKQNAGDATTPAAASVVPVPMLPCAASPEAPAAVSAPSDENPAVSEPIHMQQPQEAHVQQQQKQQQQSDAMNPTLRPHAEPTLRLAGIPEVIELSADAGAGDASILSAVMKHVMNEVVECPLRPPMCPEARLAVSRDRRIILIAVARHGLGDLRSIGLAYRWVVENRSLLAMALPQFVLDAHQLPHLRLLVDQADSDADVLQPIFQANNVSIHTYRHVRWGERTGLLLDAA